MNALSASILHTQLDMAHEVLDQLKQLCIHYIDLLEAFAQEVSRQVFPSGQHMSNGHLFAWLAKDADEQKKLIDFLAAKGIESHSHYRSLHSSPMGMGSGIGREAGDFEFTQNLPFRIVRLPIHSGLSLEDVGRVAEAIKLFYCDRTCKKA
jgi:dTDP-4-amino-4,6-dideoxygalactose transaminase